MIESKARLVDMCRGLSGKIRLTFEVDQIPVNLPDKIKDICLMLSVSKWKEKRSINANRLLWSCIGKLAAEMRADKWDVYLLMLSRYGKYTYICVKPEAVPSIRKQWREIEEVGTLEINGHKAVELLCYYGSSTLNTKEFSVLLDGVISEMKEIGLPTPDSDHVEQAMIDWLKEHG